MSKNRYQLTGSLAKNGYDWWWHSFVGLDPETGEQKPFFIEYYIINPALWEGKIVLGQQSENKQQKNRPCYAMIKAGTWGEDKAQIHEFFGFSDIKVSCKEVNCVFGINSLSETCLKGSLNISQDESTHFPERMTDAGSMKWDLTVNKKIKFDVGYGSSKMFSELKMFKMFWHVEGMLSEYKGTIEFNNKKYIVEPESSFGYQDKNWGSDYTNPWIWLNCNNFISLKTGKPVIASLDVGGGCPVVMGIPLNRKILTAFYYNNEMHEFNFSKFWKFSKQKFRSYEDNDYIFWEVISENKYNILDIRFKCKKDLMLLVNYENPIGEKLHKKLWNGGHAEGIVKFYRKGKELVLIDELQASFGGCEYGEY